MRKLIFLICLLYPALSLAAESNRLNNLLSTSISELTNLPVTSVSKLEESRFRSPAAIYVLTSEDLRRLGVQSIPEALRFVPGLDVAQISANKWAISARGFTDQLSNKLLVLMDGRSVYSPHFSGVYWDVQDALIEDVERIEVIRGPGAALWGANAVNGVINIITRQARDSQGGYVSTGFGNAVQNITQARYGSRVGDNLFYRSYAKYSKWDDLTQTNGANANDGWFMQRGGFRVDYEASPQESYTFQGDIYEGNENKGRILRYPSLAAPYVQPTTDAEGGDVGGGNFMFRREKQHSPHSQSKLQVYYDNARRDYADQGILGQTFDMELQRSFLPHPRHQLLVGAGARYVTERTDGSTFFDYPNDHKYYHTLNSFVQDKIALRPDSLYLTLGSKLEENSFSDVEWQPSARLAWHVDDKQTVWTAVSRAVRTPSRAENDLRLVVGVAPGAGYLKWQGTDEFDAETLTAYELGYRIRPFENFSFDATGFIHDYSHLRTAERGALFPAPNTARFYPFSNNGYGESYGIELSADYQILPNWRLSANYTFLSVDLHTEAGSTDTVLAGLEGNAPKNRFNLQSSYKLSPTLEWNQTVYYNDNRTSLRIPSYTRVDSSLIWKAQPNLEFALAGQNLLDDQHPEFSASLFSSATNVPRSVFGSITWRF